MKIIVPCAGKSKRFPNLRPKWMLTHPNGNLMIKEALRGLNYNEKDLIITILKEHEDKYKISKGLRKQLGNRINICILNKPTRSQSETVYMTINKMNISENFFVKDSDNYFKLNNLGSLISYVTCVNLNSIKMINPSNKSYLVVNENKLILNVVEKKVISDTFSVGGYYFKSVKIFRKAYEELNKKEYEGELYLSAIISYCIHNNLDIFTIKIAKDYLDWGTLNDWNSYKKCINCFICDIDGVLVKNGAEFFKPYWGELGGIKENIELINQLYDKGNQILLLTSRNENFREKTIQQLNKFGIKYHRLIMDCYHGKRVIINDYSKSNSCPSAIAINIKRDSNQLSELLENYIKDYGNNN